ncbi:sigma-70 family RNA polymerase sigma factor [Streptomyces sp. NPDC001750]|uniref:sigma-70 family RNA polymerase sigma factor n=1 Tax=Streptomyces sp. NPDC001750 TaxID=3364607 RepID=UPI0036AC09E6
MTAPSTTTSLTAEQKEAAAPFVYGATDEAIAAQLHLSVEGVTSRLKALRARLNCKGASRPVVVHALLTARHVAPPRCNRAVPDFTEEELRLLRAVAEHSVNTDIGRAIGMPASRVWAHIDALVAKACADNPAHMVGLGHTWGLLDTTVGSPSAAVAPVTEPSR